VGTGGAGPVPSIGQRIPRARIEPSCDGAAPVNHVVPEPPVPAPRPGRIPRHAPSSRCSTAGFARATCWWGTLAGTR